MKKFKKAMLLVLCAVLLVAGSVMGTLAYLQAQTGTITNTFTAGTVDITLQEYGIDENGEKTDAVVEATTSLDGIKLVPGRVIEKVPFITVADDSEDCILFVVVENNMTAYGEIDWATGWTRIGTTNVWYYNNVKSADDVVNVFDAFVCDEDIDDYGTLNDATIKITAYAVQAEGFATTEVSAVVAADVWDQTFGG